MELFLISPFIEFTGDPLQEDTLKELYSRRFAGERKTWLL